jgi:hypothetical protein
MRSAEYQRTNPKRQSAQAHKARGQCRIDPGGGGVDDHAFDTIEKAVDERPPIDSDFNYQRLAVVVESRDTHWSPRGLPTNRFSPVQPQTKANAVTVLAAHQLTGAGHVREERQTRSQALAKGLAFARKHRHNRRSPVHGGGAHGQHAFPYGVVQFQVRTEGGWRGRGMIV